MTKTIAKLTVDSLIEAGFSRLYCLPGVQNDDFFDALYDRQSELAPVHARHEQGAAYMALGAAMATGTPQVCCVVPGPGFLNASAALSTAWAVNAPVLMLVGQTSARNSGRGLGELHEIPDQFSILRQLTKFSARLDRAETAAGQMAGALQQLTQGRPRPVGLEVPVDLWTQATAPAAVAAPAPAALPDLAQALAMIEQAKKPLIFTGSGGLAHAEAVRAFARAIGAPVAAHRNGRGVMPASDPLSLLPPVMRRLYPEADLVIGLGTRLGAKLGLLGRDASLRTLHIDIDPQELQRGSSADLRLEADLGKILPPLTKALAADQREEWRAQVARIRAEVEAEVADALAPQKAWLDVLGAYLGTEGILVSDLTQIGYAAEAIYPVERPRSFLTPGFQGTLGWSVATGLGAADACRDRPVVTIAGDGGAMFTLQELASAAQHKIPMQLVIFSDNCFGNVRRFQIHKYGGRPIASALENPDFVALARSFGLRATRAETPEALAAALEAGRDHAGTSVIEIPVGEFPSPWPYLGPRKLRG